MGCHLNRNRGNVGSIGKVYVYQFMHSLVIEPMTLALPELVFCGCKKSISNWNTVSLAKTKTNPCAANVFILNLYRMQFRLSRTKRNCSLSKLLFIGAVCGVSLMTMIVSHYKLF